MLFSVLFIDLNGAIKQNCQYSVLIQRLGYEMTAQLTSLLSAQADRVSCLDIDVFSLNPRRSTNPVYDEIKQSISKKGIQNPLHIVFHPVHKKWVLSQGGQTRLLICRELYEETQEESYLYPPVIQKPYTSDLDLCINHLVENHLRGENSFLETAHAVMNIRKLMADSAGVEPTQDELAEQMASRGMPIRRQSITAIFYASEILAPKITNISFLEELSRKVIDSIRTVRKAMEPNLAPSLFDAELIELINTCNERITVPVIKAHFYKKYSQSTSTPIVQVPTSALRFSNKFGLDEHLVQTDALRSGFVVALPEQFESKAQVEAYLLLLGLSGVFEENVNSRVLKDMGFQQLKDGCDPSDLAGEIINRLQLSTAELLTYSTRLFGLGDDKTFESYLDLVVGIRERFQNQTTIPAEIK